MLENYEKVFSPVRRHQLRHQHQHQVPRNLVLCAQAVITLNAMVMRCVVPVGVTIVILIWDLLIVNMINMASHCKTRTNLIAAEVASQVARVGAQRPAAPQRNFLTSLVYTPHHRRVVPSFVLQIL